MTATAARSTTASARNGRDRLAGTGTGGNESGPAGDDPANRFTGLRMALQRGLPHALVDFKSAGFFAFGAGNGLVNIGGHDRTNEKDRRCSPQVGFQTRAAPGQTRIPAGTNSTQPFKRLRNVRDSSIRRNGSRPRHPPKGMKAPAISILPHSFYKKDLSPWQAPGKPK